MGDSHQSDKCTTLTENKSFVQLSPRHRYASNRYKCHALNIHFTLYDFNSRLYHFSRVNSHELCGRIPQKLREKKIKNTTTKNRHGNRCKNASSKAINRTYTYLTRSRFQGFSSSISSNMIYFHLARSHYYRVDVYDFLSRRANHIRDGQNDWVKACSLRLLLLSSSIEMRSTFKINI